MKITVHRRAGRRAELRVRLADGVTGSVTALVEARVGARRWKVLGTPRLVSGRVYRVTLRLPSGRAPVTARASVIDASRSVVTTFSGAKRA